MTLPTITELTWGKWHVWLDYTPSKLERKTMKKSAFPFGFQSFQIMVLLFWTIICPNFLLTNDKKNKVKFSQHCSYNITHSNIGKIRRNVSVMIVGKGVSFVWIAQVWNILFMLIYVLGHCWTLCSTCPCRQSCWAWTGFDMWKVQAGNTGAGSLGSTQENYILTKNMIRHCIFNPIQRVTRVNGTEE